MTETLQRLFTALFFAILCHTVLLFYRPEQNQVTPAPLNIQRITVSLGIKKTTKQQTEIQPAVLPKNTPTQAIQKTPRKLKPPVRKPRKIVSNRMKHKLTPTVTMKEVAAELQPDAANAKDDKENAAMDITPAAAQIIQQATPLYQINPPPKYPDISRRRGQEGLVVLEALIDISGNVSQLKISNSSGYPLLDSAALKAVRHWRFAPGTRGNSRQQMWVKVPMRLRLK